MMEIAYLIRPHDGMPSIEQIALAGLLQFSITKEEVIRKDFKRVNEFIEVLRKAKTKARSKVIISFDYDDDPREIYVIQEVREYIRELWMNHLELFYYIHLGGHEVFTAFILCLSDVLKVHPDLNKIGSQQVIVKLNPVTFKTIAVGLADYMESVHDTDLKKMAAISDKLKSYFYLCN